MSLRVWPAALLTLLVAACTAGPSVPITIIDGVVTHSIDSSDRLPLSLLAKAGLTSQPSDRVFFNGILLPVDRPLPEADFIQLQLRRSLPLTINSPAGQQILHSSALTVGQALAEAGYQLTLRDLVDPPPDTPITGPARIQGFDDVLYLDARQLRYVTETSGANFFIVTRSGRLVTPPLDDQILAGVTRDSVMTIAREELGLQVEERPVAIDEVLADAREAFCTGTAWTLRSVDEIAFRDRIIHLPGREIRDRLWEIIGGIQTGRAEDRRGWVRLVPEGASGL